METFVPIELGYVTIPVPNVSRAKVFFETLFGWKFEVSGPGSAHIGNTKLPFGFSTGGPTDYSTLYFQVTDIKAMVAKVEALGGSVGKPQENPSGLIAICKDDQGTGFSLWQPAHGFAT
jgi:predicted enzyme related to lactoylglutathione lyase